MELLKAFKSPFSSRVGKKKLLSTYSKILFRFNFLRLPYLKYLSQKILSSWGTESSRKGAVAALKSSRKGCC